MLKDLWHVERSRMQTEHREMKTALPRRRRAEFLDGKLNKLPYSIPAARNCISITKTYYQLLELCNPLEIMLI